MIRPCLLVFASALLGSIPVIAVVSHKHNPPEPMIYPATVNLEGMRLYNPEGDLVALCDKDEAEITTLTHCKIIAGFSLDDEMNAWLMAYESK